MFINNLKNNNLYPGPSRWTPLPRNFKRTHTDSNALKMNPNASAIKNSTPRLPGIY